MDVPAKPADSPVRRRNRILLLILLLAALVTALGGTLYLRHYGFVSKEQKEIRFH